MTNEPVPTIASSGIDTLIKITSVISFGLICSTTANELQVALSNEYSTEFIRVVFILVVLTIKLVSVSEVFPNLNA